MNPNLFSSTLTLAVACSLLLMGAGCGEKSESKPVTASTTHSAQGSSESVKAAAERAGEAIEHTAEKAWEGIKKGAHEAGHVATNVAAEVKTGAHKAEESVKKAVN